MPSKYGSQVVQAPQWHLNGATPFLEWWLIEQDSYNNRSRVGVKMFINKNGRSQSGYAETGSIWIGPHHIQINNGAPSRSGNYEVAHREDLWIPHDANGNYYLRATGDLYYGQAKYLVENVEGALPRLGQNPVISYVATSNQTDNSLIIHGETSSYGRGTSNSLRAEITTDGEPWGRDLGWQTDVIGENTWSVYNLAPNTRYAVRIHARNNNGDSSTSGTHWTYTKAKIELIKAINRGDNVEIEVNVPVSKNNQPAPEAYIEYSDDNGQNWQKTPSVQQNGNFKIKLSKLKLGKTYLYRGVVKNQVGEWKTQSNNFKTFSACVIIDSSGNKTECLSYLIDSSGKKTPVQIKTLIK